MIDILEESLLEKLVQDNLITKEQAAQIDKKQREEGGNVVEHLLAAGYMREKEILSYFINNCGFHYINLENLEIDPQAVAEIPLELIKELKVVPIRRTKDMLAVVMMCPLDKYTMSRLSEATVCRILPFVSQQRQIMETIEKLGDSLPSSPLFRSSLSYREGMPLVEHFTFENFVVGKCNEFPYAMAMAVTKALGKAYNPYFLYSSVGLGKTHLMNAIGNYLTRENKDISVMYVTCEYFCSRVVEAIKENQIDDFRESFRHLDMLLIDDIQFLRGRDQAQEEFFHIFNSLVQNSKQVVLTSDRPPSELSILEDRLRSRFMGGTIACIDHPDIETLMAILEKKSEGVELPEDVQHLLAEKCGDNIRDLEGALKTLLSFHQFTNKPIDIELARHTLEEMGR